MPKSTFVQRSYRRWLRRRIPAATTVTLNQRRIFILPTGYGMLFLLIAATLFVGGINYENNLLLTFSFFLISLFNVAILHTFRNLSGVTLSAGGMRAGFAGRHGALEVLLSAGARRAHTSLWLQWPGSPAREMSVKAGEEQRTWLDIELPHRGRVFAERLRIESRYPLGLLRAWSLVDLDHWCLAWPRPIESSECPASGGDDDEGLHNSLAGNDDFDGLRGYIPGDSLRAINWKSLAAERGLQTKVFTDPAEGRRWLEWDRLAGMEPETRLSNLCWWVLALDETNQPYGLRLPEEEIAPAIGLDHRQQTLRLLALFGEL